MTIGIYKFTNKVNNKSYIGQSINIENRYRGHLNNYNNCNLADYKTKFYYSLRKYGIDNFTFDIIESFNSYDRTVLNDREQFWISYYDSYTNGYNSNKGGEKVTERLEEHPMAKLSNDDVLNIKQLLKNTTMSQREIANNYNISQSELSNINRGKKWGCLGDFTYPIREGKTINKLSTHNRAKLSDEEIMKIRRRYVNETTSQIYEDYKDICSFTTIKRIVNGQTFKYLPVYKKTQKIWINN